METIAKFELREVLGRGGMGVVYRAYDPLMDREVALKIIQERALEVPELKARFVREARMAGKLSHDNIAVVHDLGEAEGKTYIVMEYLAGRNLRSLIDSREQLTLQEKLDFAAQICRGLHFAHANGIVHRDIKPENIQVLPDRRIKIMDFGIAKPPVEEKLPAGSDSQLALTSAGMRIGTPSYMSPEQVKGLPVDRRSDIFSMGVLLYELFTFEKPFRGDDTTVLYKIVHEEPEPLQLESTRLSSLLQRVVGKCLAKDPAARYDNCLDVLRDLQEARPRSSDVQSGEGRQNPETDRPSMLKMLPGSFVGQTVSHFRIQEKIGDGGMGTVYKAEDLTLKRTVALKFLLSEGTLNPRARERFLMEAQAASALDHPNICTIYEIGETGGGLFFICMSYCVGEDLRKILHKRSLDAQEALDICIKVALGLSKAHENGIVHRDIKPANIIVSPAGEVKVVDFGLAKLSGGSQFTRMASVMGTLPYMSPEQIKGSEVDHRTDIWSLGIVLYQALTGKLPFEGAYEAALFYAIVNESSVPPSVVRPSLPPLLDVIIAKALAKKANERYAAMSEFIKDLEQVRGEGSSGLSLDIGGSPEVTTLIENGKAYLERRKFAEALSRFEAALTLVPGHPEAGTLRLRSVQELALAKELDVLVHEAEALLERGKTRESREILLNVAARDPQHHHALELLERTQKILEREERLAKLLLDAEFYVRRGKFAEARECYQKVLELHPEHKEALRGLKRTERKREQETNRVLRKTPLPVPPRGRPRFIILAAVLLIGLAAGLTWFLLQADSVTTQSGSTVSLSPHESSVKRETQVQSGTDVSPRAANEAIPSATPASPPADLRDLVTKARGEMLAQKKRAEQKGSTPAASEVYRGGIRQEREGDRLAKSGTRDGLENALSLFTRARDSYRSVAEAAASVPEKQGASSKQQPVEEVPKSLAGTGLASQPATPETPTVAEAKHPPAIGQEGTQGQQSARASNELTTEAVAHNEINILLQDYRESIQRGDIKRLGQLLNLSEQAVSNWTLFFSSSENRRVSIEGVNIDITGDNALVTFKAKMSFFNNQTNTPQNTENPRQWTLESDDGIWRIVTQK